MQKILTSLIVVAALIGVSACCGGSDDDSSNTTITPTGGEGTAPGVATAQPGAGAGPQALTLGAPPVTVQIPAPPTFSFTVATPAEYQIDVAGEPMDAVAYLYQGNEQIVRDDDGGERNDARVVRFLTPGAYEVRVVEYRARPFSARVSAQQLQPLTPVGAITPGTPGAVAIPDTGILNRPRQDRDAARSLTLTIPAPGQYTCTATPSQQGGAQGRRIKMMLIQNGTMLEESSPDSNGISRISRQMQPGQYIVRVWEWIRRDANITVLCNPG